MPNEQCTVYTDYLCYIDVVHCCGASLGVLLGSVLFI